MTGIPSDPPERHRAIAGRFTEAVRATTDWDAPTPVPQWVARDVVRHVVEWVPGMFAGQGLAPVDVSVDDELDVAGLSVTGSVPASTASIR